METPNRNLKRFINAAYISGFIVLIVIAVATYLSFYSVLEENRWVEHTNQVIRTADQILSAVKDVESGTRGYVITKDSAYLDSYLTQVNTIPLSINYLETLTQDNPLQQDRIDTLRQIIQTKMDFSRAVINLFNSNSLAEVQQSFNTRIGKNTMDQLMSSMQRMVAEEERLLQIRSQSLKKSIGLMKYVIYFVICNSFLIAILLYIFTRRQLQTEENYKQELNHVNKELAASNEELAYTNEELIASNEEIAASNEEILTINEELKKAEEKLFGLNTQLEKRVQERTYALEKSETELRKALVRTIELNKRLAESENFLSSIIDQSPLSTWIANTEGTQIRVNQACLDLFGVPDAKLGLGKYNILKDETLIGQPFYQDIMAVFTAGKVATFNIDYNLSAVKHVNIPAGSPVSLVVTIFPVKDDAGKVTHAVIQHEDITQQKIAQEALQASEERYRAFVQQSSEAIWRFELDGLSGISIDLPEDEQIEAFYAHLYLAECNDTMAKMYGYTTAEEITGARLSDLLPRSEPSNLEYLRTFIRAGYQLADAPSTEVDKEGNTKYFINNLIGFAQDGQMVRAWGTQRDITNSKKTEEALRESEQQLRLVTDAIPVLVSYIDADERYRFNNKAYEEWFRLSRKDLYGKHLLEVVGQQAYEATQSIRNRVLRGETIHTETWMAYKDAGTRYVAIDHIPHIDHGKILGYYALITDISEQKATQQALEEALQESSSRNQELIKINNDLDNFIYTASHDLKAPITNIEGLTMVLRNKLNSKLNESEKELIQMIDLSAHRLKQTIVDLTEITKVQKDLEAAREVVNVQEIFTDVQADTAAMIAETDARIHTRFEVSQVHFARKNLRSILYNLLTNAIKYRDNDKQLTIYVRTHAENDYIVLSVSDNGLGIRQDQMNKIFMMFKRVHTHVEGTGIGLYIVKRIIENSGGKIEVESQEGKGTTFYVYFKIT